jgi:drug/metabolite transporter (DMT)-like permease
VGSLIGFSAFSYALQHLDVAIVGMYTYVNPVIAVALGTLVLGEPFHTRLLIAGAVIVAGIIIVGSPRGRDGDLKVGSNRAGDPGLDA